MPFLKMVYVHGYETEFGSGLLCLLYSQQLVNFFIVDRKKLNSTTTSTE